ncbi:MAG TPA: hypothetical protein VEL76_31420 [Gemmataceae bacterium]|nr:hypothetical protein [Gemmataceae bacterium]
MRTRILDLDGGLLAQQRLQRRYDPALHDLRSWGPHVRLGCGFGRFRRFETALADALGEARPADRMLTFCGSGDFHHVSLALLRRLKEPFNLLVIDNHPDWMRAVPIMHCGTWVYHAARLPQVQRIFHVGGDVDFDNAWRLLAPWNLLRSGKITVFPSVRSFETGRWGDIANCPLRRERDTPMTEERLEDLLAPCRLDLRRYPLYVSLDKDVLQADQAVVNWDSGRLTLEEVGKVLEVFLAAAAGDLIGMDIVGDWSPVGVKGLLRRFLHLSEHPALDVSPAAAARCNEWTNLALLQLLRAHVREAVPESPLRVWRSAA